MVDYREKRCPSCFKSVCGRKENNGGRYLIFFFFFFFFFFVTVLFIGKEWLNLFTYKTQIYQDTFQ